MSYWSATRCRPADLRDLRRLLGNVARSGRQPRLDRVEHAAPVVLGQGTRLFPDNGPDIRLELVESRTTSNGVTIQLYRPAGRPQYETATRTS